MSIEIRDTALKAIYARKLELFKIRGNTHRSKLISKDYDHKHAEKERENGKYER